MATQILAIGTTEATSSDVVVTSGGQLTVCLKDAAGPSIGAYAQVLVQLKDDAGQYFTIDTLTRTRPAIVIAAPGTYRFSRKGSTSCGVFSG